jgi:hypothetical protein
VTSPDWAGVARSLIEHWERRGFRSADPYDGLASRWLRRPRSLPRFLRHAVVQANRRLPFDARRALRVPPMRSAYAEAHFASASARLWRTTENPGDRRRVDAHLEWLRANRVDGGWAYPFDVQTGTAAYDRTTPNVICTAFAAQAFWDAWEAAGEPGARADAIGAGRFLADRLLVRESGRSWFEYYPGHGALIHNANLLAARACVRAGLLAEDEDLLAAGRTAAGTTAAAVGPSGAIRYGERRPYLWIDGHHSGFVVEALHDLAAHVPEAAEAAPRAAEFYRRRLFGADGRPLPGPGRTFPVDTIAGAQGIQTFAALGDLETTRRIAGWMLAHMRGRDGTFLYQRGRWHAKRVPYARWSDAPMALALATLALREAGA